MDRTAHIAAILERLDDGCLGDAEFCALQAALIELDSEASHSREPDPYRHLIPSF